jgi:hypothetical protein
LLSIITLIGGCLRQSPPFLPSFFMSAAAAVRRYSLPPSHFFCLWRGGLLWRNFYFQRDKGEGGSAESLWCLVCFYLFFGAFPLLDGIFVCFALFASLSITHYKNITKKKKYELYVWTSLAIHNLEPNNT